MHISAVEGYLRPSWAMWPHLGGHLGGTLAYVGVSGGILGHVGAILEAISGYLGGILGVSWGYLGPAWGHVRGERWLNKRYQLL